jgi:hypothetical protein
VEFLAPALLTTTSSVAGHIVSVLPHLQVKAVGFSSYAKNLW